MKSIHQNILQYKYKIGTGYLVPRKGTIVLKLTLQCAQQTKIRHCFEKTITKFKYTKFNKISQRTIN